MGVPDAKHLKKYEFFRNLPDAVVAELAEEIQALRLDTDEVLFHKGDRGDSLFVIRSGWIKMVSEDDDGSEVVINQAGPGNMIGEMGLLDEEPRSVGVVAMTPVELLKLKSENFVKLLNHEPILGLQVIRDLSERLQFANTYLESAIEWSQKITSGDYGFAKKQMEKAQATVVMSQQGDDDRANRFLATFFSMVEDIKKRQSELQSELDKLIIEIDEEKRESEVKELSGSAFFKKLKAEGRKLRGNHPEEQ